MPDYDDHRRHDDAAAARNPADHDLVQADLDEDRDRAQRWADAADRAEQDRLAEAAALPAVQAELAADPEPWPQPGGSPLPEAPESHRIEQVANRTVYRLQLPGGHYAGMSGDPAARLAEHAQPAERDRDDDRER
jgi:hypothetical protein